MDKNMHYDEAEAKYIEFAFKCDSATSIFAARQLEFVRAAVLETKHKPLTAFQVFPVTTDIPAGADSATHYVYDGVGIAKIISNYADDLPRVNVASKSETVKIYDIGTSYGYNDREMRNAQFANVNVSARKAQMARKAVDAKLNTIAWKGDADHNIAGFLGNTNITSMAIPTNAASTTKVEDMTAAEMVAFINDLLDRIETATNGIESANTVVLYPSAYNALATTKYLDNGGTVLQFLQGVHPEVTRWIKCIDLKGAGTSGKDVVVAGYFDDTYIRFEIPERFNQHPVEQRNLEYVINCTASTAGVTVFYPLAFIKAEG